MDTTTYRTVRDEVQEILYAAPDIRFWANELAHGRPIDPDHVSERLRDILASVAVIADAFGLDLASPSPYPFPPVGSSVTIRQPVIGPNVGTVVDHHVSIRVPGYGITIRPLSHVTPED